MIPQARVSYINLAVNFRFWGKYFGQEIGH
jgi:hypothetical protein